MKDLIRLYTNRWRLYLSKMLQFQSQLAIAHSFDLFQIPTTVQSPTSRMDFKRLLLQQSVKTGPVRRSAAEQLQLSRNQCQQQQQQSSPNTHQSPLAKVLSPRSVWRFQTPRTDVLSSTIIEDTAAEEKAMKPSPENTSPISRLNFRRQLGLCDDLPTHLRLFDREMANKTPTNERDADLTTNPRNQSDRMQELVASAPNNPARIASPAKSTTAVHDTATSRPQITNTATQYLKTALSTESKDVVDPVSAFESRRLSNQLARAQFLASTPANGNQAQNLYFKKRFRARSESPQHTTTQNVARSPSAPTLETALWSGNALLTSTTALVQLYKFSSSLLWWVCSFSPRDKREHSYCLCLVNFRHWTT